MPGHSVGSGDTGGNKTDNSLPSRADPLSAQGPFVEPLSGFAQNGKEWRGQESRQVLPSPPSLHPFKFSFSLNFWVFLSTPLLGPFAV